MRSDLPQKNEVNVRKICGNEKKVVLLQRDLS